MSFSKNSGIDGPNGWDITNTVFDSVYYTELIGGTGPQDDIDLLVDDAPRWLPKLENVNSDFTDRQIWEGFPQPTFQRIVMVSYGRDQ